MEPQTGASPDGGFDFYVLSMSWSPSYCAAEGVDANRRQCAAGSNYSFIVHGLWPQFEKGYPTDCPVGEREVSRRIVSQMLPLMPSAGLIGHQWRKHGSCSGLSQADYFQVVRAARQRIDVPPEFARARGQRSVSADTVERAFLAANPGLPADGIAVTCDRRYLREVRICLDKALEFRSCPEVDRRHCALRDAVMPPVHGG